MIKYTSYKWLIPLFFTLSLWSNCQALTRSNIQIFDSLSNKIAADFFNSLSFNGQDTLSLSFTGKDDFLIKKHIINLFNHLKIVVKENEVNSTSIHLNIITDELKVLLAKTDKEDSYKRIIKIKYTFFYKENDIVKNPLEFQEIYEDFISKSNLEGINSNLHDFAKAELPKEEPTVLEQIIEPLIMVSAAVLTVILLFTIRSN